MKQFFLFAFMFFIVFCGNAQNDTLLQDAPSCDTASSKKFRIDLGVSGGLIYYNKGNAHSPYYSDRGAVVQIPLMAHWMIASNWKFAVGLRYDFTINPIFYNVEFEGDGDQGLGFLQTPTTVTQKAYAYTSHVGIPIELKWYPWSDDKGLLGIALDFFAGYAVKSYFAIDNIATPGSNADETVGLKTSSSKAFNPWKAEVGLSYTTNIIGIFHGFRLFANLLPTYKDPTTGEKIYTLGITYFL